MKLEPISKEMFDVLYDIFYQNKRSNKVEEYNKEKSFQEAKEKGLIKKTALEEARYFYGETVLLSVYPNVHSVIQDVITLRNLYEKAIEEISKDK